MTGRPISTEEPTWIVSGQLTFSYSRAEVDTSRVAVEGGSQGGALSFATAALDNERIDLCVPHVPFLSDFRDYFKVATWPGNEFFTYFNEHPEIPEDSNLQDP